MTVKEKVGMIRSYYAVFAAMWPIAAVPLSISVHSFMQDSDIAFTFFVFALVQSYRMLTHCIAAHLILAKTGEKEQEVFIKQTLDRGF